MTGIIAIAFGLAVLFITSGMTGLVFLLPEAGSPSQRMRIALYAVGNVSLGLVLLKSIAGAML